MLETTFGDDSRLPFPLLTTLRSHVLHRPALSAVTALVVALSVALVVALQMSSESVREALSRSAEALRGRTDLEVTAGAVGMPETLLQSVGGFPNIAVAAPVVEATVRIADGPERGRALRVIGVDLLADQSIRNYAITRQGLRVLDPLRLVANSDSTIVSEAFAERLGLSDGSSLVVRSATGEHRLVVRGVVAGQGIADAYAGQMIVMDVYALQAMLGRQGWFDRIDIALTPGTDLESAKAKLAALVDGFAEVRVPSTGSEFVGAAIATLTFTAGGIALVGTFVAGLLSYAALASSVDRRVRLFALLRAAGLEASSTRRFVYFDALLFGALGVLFGIPFGVWLSGVFVDIFSATSSWLSGVGVRRPEMTFLVVLLGMLVGVGISIASAGVAARRSTRIPPHEAVATGRANMADISGSLSHQDWMLTLALALCWLGVCVLRLPVSAATQTAIVFGLGILLLWVGLRPALATLIPLSSRFLSRLFPAVGRVATASLRMRLNQTRLAVSSVAVLIGATSSLWIVASSVFAALDRASATNGGAMITASDFYQANSLEPLRPETVDAIASTPGVTSVFKHFVTETLYEGERIRLSAISSEVLAERIGLELVDQTEPDAVVVTRLHDGGILAYDTLQRRFGLRVGDSVRLNTPSGAHEFEVVGIKRSYNTSASGGVQMELSTFDRYWPRSGITNLYVWTTGGEEVVLGRIQSKAGQLQPLFFVRSADMAGVGGSTAHSFRGPIVGLLGMVLALAGVAVAHLIGGAASERRSDLGLLQCVGASGRQLVGVVVLECLWIGVGGVLFGLALGCASAVPLKRLVTEQLGWMISLSVDAWPIACLAVGTIGVAALIGLAFGYRLRGAIAWTSVAPE